MAKSPHRWNFGMPRAGERVVNYRDVRVLRNGRQYTASYHIDDADRLVISSAWGSASGPAPKVRDMDHLRAAASKLLEGVLDRRAS